MGEHKSYEEALLEVVRREFEILPVPRVVIDSVRVEGVGSTAEIVFLFRHKDRPGCRLGFRFPAQGDSPDPRGWEPVIWANLDEAINESDHGRHIDPSPDGVVWIPPHSPRKRHK